MNRNRSDSGSEDLRVPWPELRPRAKDQWGGLTEDDLDRVDGIPSRLVDVIESRYGVERERAEAQVSAWIEDLGIR